MRAFAKQAIWVGVTAAIFLIVAAGCSGTSNALPLVNTSSPIGGAATSPASSAAQATSAPVTAPGPSASAAATAAITTEATPAATAAITSTGTMQMAPQATPAAAGQASSPAGVQYRDDFTDVNSGWQNGVQFGNYFVGYHEPDHYHVDVHAPHDRAVVPIPKHTFTDFTMEAKVMAEPNNTAKTGDFRYGLMFRRSGNEFYAFVVSPRTKDWAVLKSSPNGITTLTQGTNVPTQGLTADDSLRVDVKGSSFFFTLNGQLLGTITDVAYPTGEAGFYVETFDSPRVHAHWGTVIVRDVELPEATCTVLVAALNVRSGPNLRASLIAGARQGTQLEPLGRDASGSWLKVRVIQSGAVGWVSALPPYVSCKLATNGLAVTTP